MAHLLGFDMSIDGDINYQITTNKVQCWSLKTCGVNKNSTGNGNGFQIAKKSNGLHSSQGKIQNNSIFGGDDQNSYNSDAMLSFAFSLGSDSTGIFTPTRQTFLNIQATSQPLNKLVFDMTDQSGKVSSKSVAETCSFTLTIHDRRKDN